MAAMSIFPPAPPRVPRISMPNPSNRKPSLKTVTQVDNSKSPAISVKEIFMVDTPQESTSKVLTYSPPSKFKNGMPPPPPVSQSKNVAQNTPNKPTGSNHSSPDPESIASADTLVQPAAFKEETTMLQKSMFPVYNPSVPAKHHVLFPARQSSTPLAYDPRHYASATSPDTVRSLPPAASRPTYMPRANQDSIVEVPLDVLNYKEHVFSTQTELEKLWNATSRSQRTSTAASFDLEMGRLEEATFTFGSTADNPFYAITTFDTAEISVTKTCPRKSTITCDVALASVEASSRRLPPNDGLIATIFPKTAAMLAMTQTDALTAEYDLPAEDRQELLEAAIERATNQEASYVRWNAIESRYELEHPAVSRKIRDTNFVTSPLSPQGRNKSVVHIVVVKPDEASMEKPLILVSWPASACGAPASDGVAQRSENTGDIQLASLDFNTNTLHIEGNNILEVMPSLFAIDSIFTAIAIVSVSDESTNSVMGHMKLYASKPSTRKRSSTFSPSMASPTAGAFFATIAERAEAEQEARAAEKHHKKEKKSKTKSAKMFELRQKDVDLESGRTWYGKSKARQPRKKRQIVISEFDLEKLTHYQSGSRQGQELPAFTRGLLSTVVSSLKFVVWLQTSMVQFLCWLMVAVTRGVTSEKF